MGPHHRPPNPARYGSHDGAAMKLARHFVAVAVTAAVIITVAFVWSHSGAASIVADDSIEPLRDAGPELSNIGELLQTLVILMLTTAAVALTDRARRRHRPQRLPTRNGGTDAIQR